VNGPRCAAVGIRYPVVNDGANSAARESIVNDARGGASWCELFSLRSGDGAGKALAEPVAHGVALVLERAFGELEVLGVAEAGAFDFAAQVVADWGGRFEGVVHDAAVLF
jgi:streptomycin 6-kinase